MYKIVKKFILECTIDDNCDTIGIWNDYLNTIIDVFSMSIHG